MSQLHNHTDQGSNLRFLDVCVKTTDLIDYAAELNTYAVAITEHESLSSHIKAINHVKSRKEKGLYTPKLILGNEIYLINNLEDVKENYQPGVTKFFHAILLAKDKEGHHQLRLLSSKAWGENYFRKGLSERVPTTKSDLEEIVKTNPGHLIFQTACIGGELPWHILHEDYDSARNFIDWGRNLFGDDFYLEVQPGQSAEQTKVNKALASLSKSEQIKLVVTCDVHYLKESDKALHLTFINSRDDSDQERGDFYESCWMHTPEQIHEKMDWQIGTKAVDMAIQTTNEIADKVKEYDLFHTQVVPKLPVPEFKMEHSFESVYDRCEYIKKFAYSDNIRDRYFLHLIEQGWWEKEYRENLSKEEMLMMMDRINTELEAVWVSSEKINDNVASYYITATDLVNMMWEAGSLVGTARGSAAAFYIGYLIGMHQVNSLKYNIPAWRHLHPSRPEMPDVDIDSSASKRNAIIEATRQKFGAEKVLNICTFKTEGPRSALLTCCRSMGIEPDIAQYLASLIPTVRGATTPLPIMIYGDEETETLPNNQFINECNKYEGLLDKALSIEGLVSGRSIHASGVIIFEPNYIDYNAAMRAPNGQPITQFDMNDSSFAGGLKFDFLTISNLDAIQNCIELLLKYGYIEDKGSLRATYEYYFHPDKLDYTSPEMWDMIGNHEIVNLFQFMTAVGGQAITKIKPKNLNEIFTANAIMRLMAPEGEEQPLDKYVRFKNNPELWYDCMRNKYHLTEDEIHTVEPYLNAYVGLSTMQETVMMLSMDQHIAGFDMLAANKLRKSIAKKQKKLQEQAKDNFYKSGHKCGTSDNLLNYVWKECITPQLGYSFSLPHIIGYSLIALLEANLAYKYPIEFWNCANLSTMAFAGENLSGTVDYGAIGIAIADMQRQGISISLPDINKSGDGFEPDVENHTILYGLKSISGVGDSSIEIILSNRPYKTFEDFAERIVNPKLISNSTVIALIKAGAFTHLDSLNPRDTLAKYISQYLYAPNSSLTLANMAKIQAYGILPEELDLQLHIYNYRNYVTQDKFVDYLIVNDGKRIPKCGYNDRALMLDDLSQPYFQEHFSEKAIIGTKGVRYIISEKKFIKEWEERTQELREWIKSPEALIMFNKAQYKEIWNKYGGDSSMSHWQMERLSCYLDPHELKGIDLSSYGVVNYSNLPTQPEAYSGYRKKNKDTGKWVWVPKFNITRLAGTVLDSDNNHHTVSILTLQGVVNVKFNKGQYVFYNRRMARDDSWFKRGSLILVCGYRQDDIFRAYRYNDTIYNHTVNKITAIKQDGTLEFMVQRPEAEV